MKVAVWATERVVGCKQALLAGVLCLLTGVAAAQTQTPVEPAQLRLCIVGPTEYTDDLVKGTTQATGRPVIVRRLLADNLAIVSECDAVYIGKLTAEERSRLFASLIGHPVLSISEGGDQCTVGSLFCLRVGDDQVSFEVNLDSVARSGVRIHPSVLQLSRRKPAVP